MRLVAVRRHHLPLAHRLDLGQVEQARVEGGDLGEHLGAGRAQGLGEIGRQRVEETVEQGADQILEPGGAGQLVERMAADDQHAALAVEVLVRKYEGAMLRETLREALTEAYMMGAQNILGRL